MNSFRSSRVRLFGGCAALFLFCFAGLAGAAQQPDEGKANVEALTAGRDGVTMPQCQYCPSPEYSHEAKKKKYEGVVVLSVVVTSAGKATNIRVLKTPGLGLDEKAIEAVRKWRFKPAMKDGAAVAAQVPILVTFRLGG